ncbi:hypothetical protein ACWF94_00910 [Streptomyces sp. NPDC055078]
MDGDWDGRAAGIRKLVDAGSVAGLATELHFLWGDAGEGGVDEERWNRLRDDIPDDIRVPLLLRLTEGLEEQAVHAPQRCRRDASLITFLARGLSAERLTDWRDPLLALASGNMALWEGWRLTCLVEVEQAAGRALPGSLVAAVRRTALIALEPGDLVTLAAAIREPALNPGEPWAELANTDVERCGEPWRPLIAHALTSTGSRPTRTWERAGQSLLDTVGAARARDTIASWLALAGERRTWPVTSYHGKGVGWLELDPFNARALRGLASLLALAPPDPAATAVLGTLVEAALIRLPGIGLRSPKLASAAVHALARIGDDTAEAELDRLAAAVTYKPTLRVIDKALTAGRR